MNLGDAAQVIAHDYQHNEPSTALIYAAHAVLAHLAELEATTRIAVEWGAHRSDIDEMEPANSENVASIWVANPTDPADYVVRREIRTITGPWTAAKP